LLLAREAASKLAVVFVITPKEHMKNPWFARKLKRMCELSGAHCAIVPSPDMLVASLAQYAVEVSGKRVTDFEEPEAENAQGGPQYSSEAGVEVPFPFVNRV